MTILCKGYSAKRTGDQIELTIVEPQAAPADDRVYLTEIAQMLRKSVKAVDKLSRRVKNPLPLIRGNGRPYGFRSQINAWLAAGVPWVLRDFPQ